MQTIVLAIVAPTDELSLSCMTSLLRLQVAAVKLNECKLDVRVAPTFLEALNLHEHGEWVVILDAFASMSEDFVFGVLKAPYDVIAGVYPLAQVDWDRVRRVRDDPDATESLRHAGNVYNLTPKPTTLTRYAPICDVQELKVAAVRSEFLKSMAGPDISFDGGHLFAHESVFENKLQNAYQTFVRKCRQHGGKLAADLAAPCSMMGTANFAGCVGMRRNGLR